MLHLQGIKVLDLSRLLPGPMCTLLLADIGADVLKIEDTMGGDYARYYPPLVGDSGAFFASLNRNKRSMTLNLKDPRGAELLRELVCDADVLLESFRPGVMERLGVGYDVLRERNPGLVYCAITGFGQSGPDRDRAGHDNGYLARSGLLALNGRRGESVHLPSFQLADIAGGALQAAFGICAALVGRARTGEGAFVDISMTEGALALAMPAIASHAAGEPQVQGDNLLTGGVPCYDVYETSDGRALAVGGLEPKFWSSFVVAIGRPDLLGDGLATGPAGARVREEIAAVLATKTLAEWTTVFGAIDACVEPALRYSEVLEDAQHLARRMFFTLGGVQHVRTPLAPADREHTPAPAKGAHTDDVLRQLGRDDAAIDELRAHGVV